MGFSLQGLLLLQSQGSEVQALVVVVRGLAAPCRGVILDGDQTHVPCISVWILSHWTGGVLLLLSFPTLGGIS